MPNIGVTQTIYTVDMDSLACTLAYTELLKLENRDSCAYIPGIPNSTVTEEIQKWDLVYEKEPKASDLKNMFFVIVDTSDINVFPKFVDKDKVIEIFDHHIGHTDYWRDKIGMNARIEMVGACATLIWEEFKKRGKAGKISQLSARLLLTAILSNTLHFRAKITSIRDERAYKELFPIAGLTRKWVEKYFLDQESFIYSHPKDTVFNDIKLIDFPNLGKKIAIGQVELWDSRKFIMDFRPQIRSVLEEIGGENWFFNAPCIAKGKSYIYTENKEIKNILSDKFHCRFNDGVGDTQHLIERKDLVKILSGYGEEINTLQNTP